MSEADTITEVTEVDILTIGPVDLWVEVAQIMEVAGSMKKKKLSIALNSRRMITVRRQPVVVWRRFSLLMGYVCFRVCVVK